MSDGSSVNAELVRNSITEETGILSKDINVVADEIRSLRNDLQGK